MEEARRRIASADPRDVLGIHGSFALVAREGEKVLLARSLEIVQRLGWSVANADITIVLERPKLAGHVPQITERLAATLGISRDCVSVKGKTNEGVDAVGRGEAIAAHAVVMLVAAPGAER